MNSKSSPLYFALISALALCATCCAICSQAEAGPAENLISGVPLCGHISSSSSVNYTIDIEPQTTAATFILRWKNEGSPLDLVLRSPEGRVISSASSGFVRNKTSLTYSASRPEEGRWTVDVRSGSLPERGEDYCVLVEPKLSGEEEVDKPKIRFSGQYRDYGRDQNGDGFSESVILEVGLNVREAGDYTIEGSLYDVNDGMEIPVSNSSHLNFRSKAMELELYDMKTPGPYRLKSLVIYDEKGNKVARSTAEYETREYRDLLVRSVKFNGNYSDYGSDINGDGWYDYLTVDVGVDVIHPGEYNLMGSLYDANGTQLAWSLDYGNFSPGTYTMHLDFDGKSLWMSKVNGPYYLKWLSLERGNSEVNMSGEDDALEDYVTGPYNYSQFVDPAWPEKVLSGRGSGEILLTISVQSFLPVFQGRYSYDIIGVNMPPFDSNWTAIGLEYGLYVYNLPGIQMPNIPNNFTVTVSGVKNLNVGVRKDREAGVSRTWVSTQALADEGGTAVIDTERISPGRYQFKIFGEAADDATQVALDMTVVKKLVINGDFVLALNTTGFPSGNYSISARALNGSLSLDELKVEGPSAGF